MWKRRRANYGDKRTMRRDRVETFELEGYRSVESVTKRWEREQRLLDQLADARRDLSTAGSQIDNGALSEE